jgi:hypothetical protein
MGRSALSLRFLLILLVLADLYLLARQLLPLQKVFELPLNGAVGFDPAICLVVYIGLFLWLPSRQSPPMVQVLGESLLLGLLAGGVLILEQQIQASAVLQQTDPPLLLLRILMGAAALVFGIAGLRGGRITGNASIGVVTGIWSAMTAGLLGATAVLVRMAVAGPPPVSNDPWKQYEGLAIGNDSTQALVQSLNSTTFFLLVCPLAGGLIGLIFAIFGQKDKA